MNDILRKCKNPYYLRGGSVYIHPDDVLEFHKDRKFISVISFPYTHEIKPMMIGQILGLRVYVQDDMQILLLAMNGGKNVEKEE